MHTEQHQVCKLLTAESPTPGLLLFVCGFHSLRTTDALPPAPRPPSLFSMPCAMNCGGGGARGAVAHVLISLARPLSQCCLYAGLEISGINGEVMPGQWGPAQSSTNGSSGEPNEESLAE